MKTIAPLTSAAVLAGYAFALPQYAKNLDKRQTDPHYWSPPSEQPGSVRAPCPGLSTLANHGYINRSGRGISAQDVQQGFLDAFGMGTDATAAGATNAINLCSTLTGTTCTTFDLDQLDTPHQIEHDASLTRLDRNMSNNLNADNYDFNQGIWDQTRAIWGDVTHVNVNMANSARLSRITEAKQQDAPGWFLENEGGSLTEHGFYLTTMNDNLANVNDPQARLDWMDHWFVNQELPTALGWAKPTPSISNDHLQSIVASVSAASTVAPAPTAASKRDSLYGVDDTDENTKRDGLYEGDDADEKVKRGIAENLLGMQSSDPSRVQNAAASATSATGPKPTLVNAYVQVLSPEEWSGQSSKVEGYLTKFLDNLGGLIGG